MTTATVTLRVPISWQAQSTGSGDVFGPTIHVWRGYAIGRLNVMVFRGNIDDLAPQFCAGHGSVPGGIRGPSSVTLDERGFAPVGDRTAQYRQWTATCPNGPESHRAWVLPVTGLLFWETCSDSRIGPIVTNASVRTPIGVQSVDSPPPSTIPHNCDDTDLTDITTGP